MQITHNHKNLAAWALRVLILLACAWFIFSKVDASWSFDLEMLTGEWSIIVLVSLLAVVNWGLEVWRWKISLNTMGNSGWSVAMQQVFGGLALNWVMPFTSGDLAARLLPHADKRQAGVLIYYNRAIMLGITLIFGGYGVYVNSIDLFQSRWWVFVFALGLLGIVGWLVMAYLKRRNQLISQRLLVHLMVLSAVRYAVFAFQFYLLLAVFNPSLSGPLIFAGVGWIFLFRSIVPSLFGNLGVREAGALLFFEPLVTNMLLVLTPSLLIWIINTVAPSVLGLYFLLKYKTKLAA